MDYLDNLKYKINNDIDLIEDKILRRLFKELMMEILNLKERELKKKDNSQIHCWQCGF